jgi:hypothetical protein
VRYEKINRIMHSPLKATYRPSVDFNASTIQTTVTRKPDDAGLRQRIKTAVLAKLDGRGMTRVLDEMK